MGLRERPAGIWSENSSEGHPVCCASGVLSLPSEDQGSAIGSSWLCLGPSLLVQMSYPGDSSAPQPTSSLDSPSEEDIAGNSLFSSWERED